MTCSMMHRIFGKSNVSVLFVAVMALIISACATTGREISDAQIAELRKGETNRGQAAQILGNPIRTTRQSTGREIWIYSFSHVQARPESFVPIVGAFAGGADSRSSSLVLIFNEAGILQDYTSSRSATGSGTGFASGKYQRPDRSLPQEAQ